MKISIVIPAFNEAKLIGETLRRIKAATVAFTRIGWEVEMVVCDNNSTDATAQLAESEGARVVFEPVNQIARARNTGAAAATGGWLLFIDADSHPTAELFADVAREIETGRAVAGGSTIELDERSWSGDLVTLLWNSVSRLGTWMAGSFIFCDAAVFRQIGGFSLQLFASEELDLTVRLKKAARKAGRKVVILHRHPLVTSARKMHLYSRVEWFCFLLRAVFRHRKTLTSREECMPWYDGRR